MLFLVLGGVAAVSIISKLASGSFNPFVMIPFHLDGPFVPTNPPLTAAQQQAVLANVTNATSFPPGTLTAIGLMNPGLEAHSANDDNSQRLILPNTSPGDRVAILGRFQSIKNQQHQLGWFKIQTKDGAIGFVPVEQLSQLSTL